MGVAVWVVALGGLVRLVCGSPPPVRTKWTRPHHRGVVADPPSLSAVLAQPARLAGVQPDETRPQQRAIRLDTGQTGWFRLRRRQRRGIRDKGDHKQHRQQTTRPRPIPPLQSARRRHRLFTMGLTFRRAHTRPPAAHPDACAVTRTGARSCQHPTAGRQRNPATLYRTAPPSGSFLNQREAVRKRLSNHRPTAPTAPVHTMTAMIHG